MISPRRASDGFPIQRLLLLCAVIEKRLKLSLWSRDVYLNVVGGLVGRTSNTHSHIASSLAYSQYPSQIQSTPYLIFNTPFAYTL